MQNLIFGIPFSKILFRAYIFLYSSAHSSGYHQSFFLVSDFLAKVTKPTKSSGKDHSFYNKVSLKKSYSFYEHQLT